jgi:hypothetical protein
MLRTWIGKTARKGSREKKGFVVSYFVVLTSFFFLLPLLRPRKMSKIAIAALVGASALAAPVPFSEPTTVKKPTVPLVGQAGCFAFGQGEKVCFHHYELQLFQWALWVVIDYAICLSSGGRRDNKLAFTLHTQDTALLTIPI